MSDFDVIVVGAGLAGNTAAYLLAKAGLGVLVIERSETIGGKNVTGGRMYSHSLEKIFPDFAKEAPLGRRITKERISMLTFAVFPLGSGFASSAVGSFGVGALLCGDPDIGRYADVQPFSADGISDQFLSAVADSGR